MIGSKMNETQLTSQRGKIVFALGAESLFQTENPREFIRVRLENLDFKKSVFENLSAPLAAVGTPWETAQKRIEKEQLFWIESAPVNLTKNTTDAFAETLAIARACLAKPQEAALVIPQRLLTTDALEKLRIRANAEHFAVIVLAEKFSQAFELNADIVAVLYGKNEIQIGTPNEVFRAPTTLESAQKTRDTQCNVFTGTLIGTGAGEFFANFAQTQIHGQLCANNGNDASEGDTVHILLPPEIFHLDAFPPDENYFELGDGGEISFDGRLFLRDFKLKNAPDRLRVAAQHRQTLESPKDAPLFAWFFPEDTLGFLTEKNT